MSDFLENMDPTSDPMLLHQIRTDCDQLIELKAQMDLAEERFKQAKKAYDTFACQQLPHLFKNNGLDSISTTNGLHVRIVTQTRASIKKGSDEGLSSKQEIGKWLHKLGAEHLISSQCIVPSSQKEKLTASGVIFQEKVDINTNSLKAFICDQLGQKGSPATITLQDIPKSISFFQWDEAIVE